jgi:hypothetical protein
LVTAQWNKLSIGIPVTFEMRWKAKKMDTVTNGIIDGVEWVLASCVPVVDTNGRLMSIAGNTVDINVWID